MKMSRNHKYMLTPEEKITVRQAITDVDNILEQLESSFGCEKFHTLVDLFAAAMKDKTVAPDQKTATKLWQICNLMGLLHFIKHQCHRIADITDPMQMHMVMTTFVEGANLLNSLGIGKDDN